MSSGWGCPHENQGHCRRRGDEECDPGADGCVLEEGLRRSAEALHPDGPDAEPRRPEAKTPPRKRR